MSHRHDCPDPYQARREGDRYAGYGDWTSRYSNPYSGQCDEAARAWERGYESRKEELAEEQRREQQAQQARERRAFEEAEQERMYYEQQEEIRQQEREEADAAERRDTPPDATLPKETHHAE